MSTERTPEEIETMRQELAAHDAAQAEAAKLVNRALLAPLVAFGFGGTEPLTCSLSAAAAALRTHGVKLMPADPEFPAYAVSVAKVMDDLDRRLRTLVARNAATPEVPPVEPPVEPQGEQPEA